MSFPSSSDQQGYNWLLAALKDPAKRAKVMQALSADPSASTATGASAGTGTGTSLSNLGAKMSSAPNSQTAIATGIGGVLGAGIAALKRRSGAAKTSPYETTAPNNPDRGVSGANQVTSYPDEPNLSSKAGSLTPNAQGTIMMGRDRAGNNITSTDGGTTWKNDQTGEVENTPAYGVSVIAGDPGIGVPAMSSDPGASSPTNDVGVDIPDNIAGINQFRKGGIAKKAFGGSADEDLPLPAKKSKGVLLRRPVPVLSTTIVIAKKKPPEKKKAGGPPSPYAKGGHVQVPKGSGVASRGKRFRGIF